MTDNSNNIVNLDNITDKRVYNEYNSYWENIGNFIRKQGNLDIYNITFNNECPRIDNVIYKGNTIKIDNNYELKKQYHNTTLSYIENIIANSNYDVIIELGSGWGRNLFYFIKHCNHNKHKYISGEYTQSGIDIQNYLKNRFFNRDDIDLDIYSFDYNNSHLFFDNIKAKYNLNNIFVFTHHSIEQITYLQDTFFTNLLNISKNIKCVHIEPIGWQISNKSLMKENTSGYSAYYNKNLYEKLQNLQNDNKITINNVILDYFNFGGPQSCGTLVEWTKL